MFTSSMNKPELEIMIYLKSAHSKKDNEDKEKDYWVQKLEAVTCHLW